MKNIKIQVAQRGGLHGVVPEFETDLKRRIYDRDSNIDLYVLNTLFDRILLDLSNYYPVGGVFGDIELIQQEYEVILINRRIEMYGLTDSLDVCELKIRVMMKYKTNLIEEYLQL